MENFFLSIFNFDNDFNNKSNPFLLSLIPLYALNKKLLEVGCGSGSETNNYLRYVKSYVGVDISSEGIKEAIKNINQSIYEIKYFEKVVINMGLGND